MILLLFLGTAGDFTLVFGDGGLLFIKFGTLDTEGGLYFAILGVLESAF